MKRHQTIHWFRKGLRLHDNPALLDACETSAKLWPLYVLDPDTVTYGGNIGFNRWRFLLESLKDLDDNLRKLNSRLIVVQGKPIDVIPRLIKEWKITKLTFEVEPEPHRRVRDEEITKHAQNEGVEVVPHVSHTLFDLKMIVEKNDGCPPITYKKFQAVLKSLGYPKRPVPTVTELADNPLAESIEERLKIPSLEDLGVVPSASETPEAKFPGGETIALERMERYLAEEEWVCKFEKPRTSPNSLEPSTTVLSPYTTFGCLSARTFYWKLSDVYSRAKKHSYPPVSLHGQLLWREFFYTAACATPNFSCMEGNSLCLQVPWDVNDDFLRAWSEGRTGYPFIDAIMTQLRTEGWIHHLARHAVACFLTRGDLWISWESGLKVFETYLLDHDWSLNAGNWLWLSASAFFHAYFRVYSPIAFGKKTDPNGDYIRKYVPCLKKFPSKYIFEPWDTPLSVQQKCGCIVGKDYPRPIVNHSKIVKKNMERMKKARMGAGTVDSSSDRQGKSPARKRQKNEESPRKKKQLKITSILCAPTKHDAKPMTVNTGC